MDFTQPIDGITREFIFKYKCPECLKVIKVNVPLKGTLLYSDISVKCPKCGSYSNISKNTNNITRIKRNIVTDSFNERILYTHQIKIFLDSVTACIALVLKADGKKVDSREVSYFKEFCKAYSQDENIVEYGKERLKFFLKNQKQAFINLKKLKDSENKTDILELLCELSISEGSFNQNKEKVIREISSEIEIPYYRLSEIIHNYKEKANSESRFRTDSANDTTIEDPYKVLEISPNATFEEIKTAYKNKCKEYHPDKYANAPKRIQEFATNEMAKINSAYNYLRSKYDN